MALSLRSRRQTSIPDTPGEHQVEDEHVVPVAPHGLESGFAVRDGIDVESLRP